jgi:hypothetical protein
MKTCERVADGDHVHQEPFLFIGCLRKPLVRSSCSSTTRFVAEIIKLLCTSETVIGRAREIFYHFANDCADMGLTFDVRSSCSCAPQQTLLEALL